MIKAGLERVLQAELTDHLGYDKHDAIGHSRNGSSKKTVASSVGDIVLDVPRDRAGTFSPTLVRIGQRRLGGLESMIISLYAGGMTIRDIHHHLATTIGTELSRETISKITDAVEEEVSPGGRPPLGRRSHDGSTGKCAVIAAARR